MKTARTARRIAVSHVDRGLDLRAHAALNLRAAARTFISLPKSQDFKLSVNSFRIDVDMNPPMGDYGFVVINRPKGTGSRCDLETCKVGGSNPPRLINT